MGAVDRTQPPGPVRRTLRDAARNDGEVLGWSLATWLSDPALASVRDPAALAKLPDAEREPWRRLWTDVAASLAADPLEQGREHAGRRQWDRAFDATREWLGTYPAHAGSDNEAIHGPTALNFEVLLRMKASTIS